MPTKKILELNTLIPDRLGIDIDGKLYEIKDKSEIGLENLISIGKLYEEITSLQEVENFGEEHAQILSHDMDKFCRLLLIDCPDEVHNRLQDGHRVRIFEAFQEAVGGVQPQMNRQQRRTAKK